MARQAAFPDHSPSQHPTGTPGSPDRNLSSEQPYPAGSGARRWAVLFKTHFWDDFVARRFEALKSKCPASDIWIYVDETSGLAGEIPHDKVFRTRDSDMYALGFPRQPVYNINWYNVDYPLLAFHESHAEYAFYIMVEFDAAVLLDLDNLAVEALSRGIDLIAFPSSQPVAEWSWSRTLVALWPLDQIRSQLLCVAGLSERAVAHLMTTRREHAARDARGELQYWPFSEGLVPTALHAAGFKLESLTSFGATDYYDWWPPYHESELGDVPEPAFMHPVLCGERYVRSLLQFENLAEVWLTESQSPLTLKVNLEPPAVVVPALIEALVRDGNWVGLTTLRQAIDDRGWHNPDFSRAIDAALEAHRPAP
ncbi:MAG TPA: hypothetical protein VGG99_06535 [Acetobacteraceae bacterium]|jgi:hypothetical protein